MPSGGPREGSGAHPKLDRQLEKADKLARRLQIATKIGLAELAQHLPRLFADEIKAALHGDVKARRFLIEIAMELVQIDERPQTPIGAARQQFQVNIGVVQNVGDDSPRPATTIEYIPIPGAEGGPPEPSPD